MDVEEHDKDESGGGEESEKSMSGTVWGIRLELCISLGLY